MRYEIRLIAAALLILALIAMGCRCEAIAEVRRGLDGPPAARCERDCGDNLKNRGKSPQRVAASSGAARK
jgi:hypothetical protein